MAASYSKRRADHSSAGAVLIQSAVLPAGSLPSTLSNARGMRYLELSFHNLEGPLPTLPESLMVLDVSENSLTGTVPGKCKETKSPCQQLIS
jgi:hypothetical protein